MLDLGFIKESELARVDSPFDGARIGALQRI